MNQISTGASLMLILVWLAFMIGIFVGWIMIVTALWRGMKAHESIARSIGQYVRLQNHFVRNDLDEKGK